jgi:hypothetical protein
MLESLWPRQIAAFHCRVIYLGLCFSGMLRGIGYRSLATSSSHLLGPALPRNVGKLRRARTQNREDLIVGRDIDCQCVTAAACFPTLVSAVTLQVL